jgi:hypothetical protein
MHEEKKLSATQLAEIHNIHTEQLFDQLSNQVLIEKVDGKWILTHEGEEQGGIYQLGKYSQYIAWPENFDVLGSKKDACERKLSIKEICCDIYIPIGIVVKSIK